MKRFKQILSIALVMVLLVSSANISSFAETIYDKYGYYYELEYVVNSNSDYYGFTMDDLKFDTVDGAKYAYTVKDGEATIFNVRTNFVGPEKGVFTLATHLGGYPVTAIGNSKNGGSVFYYYQYPGEVDPENFEDRAEIDPGLWKYVSKIVIPEGYEVIYEGAFQLVAYKDVSLPKSLKYVHGDAFENEINFVTEPEPGVNGIEPATDTPYVTYGNRDYKVNVTGSPSKIQVVRNNGGTTTIDRRKATVTSNGDTETWIVNMRVEAGTHNIRAKYGNVWDDKLTPFTVKYDLPGAYSFDLTYENGIGNFNVVTDPEVIKIQFALDNGCTLTYSQTNSYIGEDGLRHWEISRKIPTDRIYTLRTKYGYTWTDTNLEVNTII